MNQGLQPSYKAEKGDLKKLSSETLNHHSSSVKNRLKRSDITPFSRKKKSRGVINEAPMNCRTLFASALKWYIKTGHGGGRGLFFGHVRV